MLVSTVLTSKGNKRVNRNRDVKAARCRVNDRLLSSCISMEL